MKKQFEVGQIYRGTSRVGYNDIKVIKRTEKTVTVETSFGINRVKIKDYNNAAECATFKSWSFNAIDIITNEANLFTL